MELMTRTLGKWLLIDLQFSNLDKQKSCTRLHINLFTLRDNISLTWEELSCIVKNEYLFHFQTVHDFFIRKLVFA